MFVGGAVGKSAATVQDEPWNHCHNPDSGHALGCAWLQLCFPFSISAWKIGIQHLNTTPLSQSSRQKSDESQQVAHQKHATTLICFHHISLPDALHCYSIGKKGTSQKPEHPCHQFPNIVRRSLTFLGTWNGLAPLHQHCWHKPFGTQQNIYEFTYFFTAVKRRKTQLWFWNRSWQRCLYMVTHQQYFLRAICKEKPCNGNTAAVLLRSRQFQSDRSAQRKGKTAKIGTTPLETKNFTNVAG